MRMLLLVTLLISTLTAAETPPKPTTIICLGDSITGHRPGEFYQTSYLKYSDLLQLALELDAGVGNVHVINQGWAGDTTGGKPSGDPPGALKRVDTDVLPAKPDIVILLIGGNDFVGTAGKPDLAAERAAACEKNLTTIVTKLKSAGIRVLMATYHEPFATDMGRVWTTLDDANPIIEKVAKANDLPSVALAPAFAAARAAGIPPEALTNPVDGVHLGPMGEVQIARTLALKLRDLAWVPAAAK